MLVYRLISGIIPRTHIVYYDVILRNRSIPITIYGSRTILRGNPSVETTFKGKFDIILKGNTYRMLHYHYI